MLDDTVNASTIAVATGVLLALFNAVLVVVTIYYARQTRRMVDEMREARRLSVLPKLAMNLDIRHMGVGEIAIRNVGQGAALDAEIELTFEPIEGVQLPVERRRWRTGVIAPGEQHRFFPPWSQAHPGQLMGMDELVALYRRVCLTGKCGAILGEGMEINEQLEDLAESWELAKSSLHELHENPAEKLAEEAEKSRRALEKQAKAVGTLVKRLPYRPPMSLDRRIRRAVARTRRQAGELAQLLRRK